MIDYKLLHTGDMVCCGAHSLFAMTIRIVTRGFKYAFDKFTSTHTGMVVDWACEKFIAEMGGRGIELNPFSEYGKWNKWIICIRQPNLSLSDESMLLHEVSHDYRNTIEYDFKGLLEFVFKRVKDDPKRMYCSEYYYERTKMFKHYPLSFAKKVSPWDLQNCDGFTYYPIQSPIKL